MITLVPESWGSDLRESNGEHSGILVALWVDPSTAETLAQHGTEPASKMHITLAYAKTGTFEAAAKVARDLAARVPALTGRVTGTGTFPPSESSDGKTVIWAKPQVMGMAEMRRALVPALAKAGVVAAADHAWHPHITLAYVDRPMRVQVPALPLRFTHLTVTQGDRRKDFRLGAA